MGSGNFKCHIKRSLEYLIGLFFGISKRGRIENLRFIFLVLPIIEL